MQTWIIVTGDLAPGTARSAATYSYLMTDPAVPNARMNVYSDAQLSLGRQTVSGSFGGPREPQPVGYQWVGTMHADPVTAPELGPPWIAIALTAGAAFIVLAARTSYPAFFAQVPGPAQPLPSTIAVAVRRGVLRSDSAVDRGELIVLEGEPVTLRAGGAEQMLRLHSAYSGIEVGELRHVGKSEPSLRIRLAQEELTLTFESDADRDAAVAALRADVEGWSGRAATQSQPVAT
jgi:hypothetical protein